MRLRDLFRRETRHDNPDRELEDDPRSLDPSTLVDPERAGFSTTEVAQAIEAATVPEDQLQPNFAEYLSRPEREATEREDAQPEDPGREPTGPSQDPRWARAVELHEEFNRAMTLENTPAAFMSDEFDYDDDVWCDDLYATPGSVRIEQELGELVRAHPDLFHGTNFELFGESDPAPESDRPEHEHDEHDKVVEVVDDEFGDG